MSLAEEPVARTCSLSENRPKWMQVAAAVRSDIQAMAKTRERRLPTEAELARRFTVSVMTVRQALAGLESEGLVVRKRRHGTFISDSAVHSRHLFMLGRISDVFEQQRSDGTTILSARWVDVPDHLACVFPGASRLKRLERMRFINSEPCNFAVNHMREDVAEAIDLDLLRRLPVSQVIAEHTDFVISEMEQELSAGTADPDMAARLQIQPLDPVMELIGSSFDEQGRILDIARIIYRADRFRFVNRVRQ